MPGTALANELVEVPTLVAVASLAARDSALSGFTCKIKWPLSEHAIYVTINDTIAAGTRCPYEVFINSKNLQHYTWTVALTRMTRAFSAKV